ncbi:Transcriptional activator spt7 [Coemansia sp. RSA 1286]|nr:Transcriptional activator spt7 [Coemansia sp. RSA 1721]KAJ2640382.1 Transcriptional activator spt7 [Coemansia sp. RSA 1286]
MTNSKQRLRSRLASGDINLATNWTQRSYHIALKLQERGEWPSYLTTEELPWLKKALETSELWSRFITPRTEQWRLHAPPSPIFDLTSPDHQDGSAPGNASEASATSPRASSKRAAPLDQDGDVDMEGTTSDRANSRSQMGKRARASTTVLADVNGDENDDMLSVLSESDIDMAMWTGEASIASNAVSRGSMGGTPASGAQASAFQEDASAFSAEKRLAAAENSIVCVMASFHARTAIFEQYVSVLCDTHGCTMCTGAASASSDVESIEKELAGDQDDGDNAEKADVVNGSAAHEEDSDSMVAEVPSMVFVKPPTPLVSRSLDEDEDYDDDEEEDEDGNVNDEKTDDSAGGSNKEGNVDTMHKDAVVELIPDDKTASGTQDEKPITTDNDKPSTDTEPTPATETETQPVSDQPADSYRFLLRGVFHTMDDLAEAVHEQEVHEIHVQQIKDVIEQRAAEPKDMLVNKIGSLQNMKNLAQFIDNHRDSVSMSTRELSHLLSEVRPKRTKWANDRRVGQVELYDALEHVLNELKAMGEVAMPFLNQVKRKDAPDYYKVIKSPMDLAAMAKNLRNEVYNNKRQFADHIQLIRDNCYTYNTEPGNYYRKSVDALLARSKQLMENVPDITVREKGAAAAAASASASVSASASGNNGGNDDVHTEFGDESGNESQSARTTYGNREGSVMPEDETHMLSNALDLNNMSSATILSRASAEAPSFAEGLAESTAGETQLVPQQQQQQPAEMASISSLAHSIMRATATGSCTTGAIADIIEGYGRPLGERIWSTKVRKQLTEYFRRIEQDASQELADRSIPTRTAENMRCFLDSTHDTEEVMGADEIAAIGRQNADIAGLRTVYSQAAGSADAAEARRRNEELDGERTAWLESSENIDDRGWDFVSECEPAAGLPLLESLESQTAKSGVLQWLNDDCEVTVDKVLGPGELQDAATASVTASGSAPAPVSTSATAAAAASVLAGDARPPIDAYAAARFPDNAMWRGMADNVDKLRSIREIDSKIWGIKLSAPMGYPAPMGGGMSGSYGKALTVEDESARLPVREIHRKYAGKPDPQVPFDLDASSARKLLQRTSALMLAHAGFDSTTEPVMSTITDFFIDYISNLGRTLRSYYDKHARTMSTEAILAHTLYDNGTEDLVELEYYLRGEIGRYSNKLSDLHKKMSKSYQDIVGDGRSDSVADASALESGDAYMTGMVGGLGDLGDDFFGFKELGLDKEFGMESLNVPQRLWYGRSAMQGAMGIPTVQEEELAHPPPGPWAPIVSPRGQIGLMKQFICKKLKEANGMDPPGYEGVADGTESPDSAQAASGSPKEEKPMDDVQLPDTWVPVPEDDSLPARMRFGVSRPRVPAPNYLTHPKTHMHVGSGQVATPSTRTAKKRPAKTTATKKKPAGSNAASATEVPTAS